MRLGEAPSTEDVEEANVSLCTAAQNLSPFNGLVKIKLQSLNFNPCYADEIALPLVRRIIARISPSTLQTAFSNTSGATGKCGLF
jgi:hypothetical protein